MKQIRRTQLPPSRPSSRARNLVHQIDALQEVYRKQNVKLAQAQVDAQELLLEDRRLYDLAPIGFVTLDRQARIRELNDKAARLLAFPASWLISRPFLVFIAKHDFQRFLECLVESARHPEQKIVELDLVVRNRIVPVQISLMTIVAATGEAIVHQMAVIDLTEVKKTESQLEESLAHWYSLVQNAPDIIMTLERSGKIVFVNMPVWGHSVNALIGTHIFNYVPEMERPKLRQCLDQVFKSDTRSECEIIRREGDRQLWFTFNFGPAKPAAGVNILTSTLVIREISDQKRSEQALRASGEQLRDFAARVDIVREEERSRIARELHDELGQALTILKLDLSWVHGKLGGPGASLRKKMKDIIAHVDDTIERLRTISSELRPSILDDLGLGAAIEWQASQIQKRTGIRTRVVSNADSAKLPKEAVTATFRVVQEALTNVIRHAEATSVRVTLKSGNHALRISVEDNGKGMTQEQMNNRKSLGIVGMKERISRLGGEFNIVSEPGKGTRLDIIIPAHND